MKRYRIVTDGEKYRIQYKTLFGWKWYGIWKSTCYGVDCHSYKIISNFPTYWKAKAYLKQKYGEQAKLDDNWIVCHN